MMRARFALAIVFSLSIGPVVASAGAGRDALPLSAFAFAREPVPLSLLPPAFNPRSSIVALGVLGSGSGGSIRFAGRVPSVIIRDVEGNRTPIFVCQICEGPSWSPNGFQLSV